jgi:maltose O-acetyltransferase
MQGGAASACRYINLALYKVVAKLPQSQSPGGSIWRGLRRYFASNLLVSTGPEANIERGADFGFGRNVSLGKRSGLGLNCRIHGEVAIGDNVMMGPEVLIYSRNHRFDDPTVPMIDQGFAQSKPVVIGDDVWIGARAVILPGVVVGARSIIGAQAVVTKDIPQGSIVGGNPARVIGNR